jgi:hypothetical protein
VCQQRIEQRDDDENTYKVAICWRVVASPDEDDVIGYNLSNVELSKMTVTFDCEQRAKESWRELKKVEESGREWKRVEESEQNDCHVWLRTTGERELKRVEESGREWKRVEESVREWRRVEERNRVSKMTVAFDWKQRVSGVHTTKESVSDMEWVGSAAMNTCWSGLHTTREQPRVMWNEGSVLTA